MCVSFFFFFFSGFIPVVINFLRRVPVIGTLLNLPGISSVSISKGSIYALFSSDSVQWNCNVSSFIGDPNILGHGFIGLHHFVDHRNAIWCHCTEVDEQSIFDFHRPQSMTIFMIKLKGGVTWKKILCPKLINEI